MLTDEYGVEYVVKPGDPAAAFLNTLKRHGFTQFVLPRALLLYGEVALKGIIMPTDRQRPSPSEYRLRDCVEVLLESH